MIISTKYFPFSPGIPWKMRKGKYLIPEIEQGVWERAVKNKDGVVLCYGGFLESLFSLAYGEMLVRVKPQMKLFWAGNPAFHAMIKEHGLFKPIDFPNISHKYPVPLFMNDHFVYFNCLNNYLIRSPWYGEPKKINRNLISKQLFCNSLVEWSSRYVPNIRHGSDKTGKYVLIILNEHNHDFDTLNWDWQYVREFASMMHGSIPVVVMAEKDMPHYSKHYEFQKLQQHHITLNMLNNAWMVLSNDVHFLIAAILLQRPHILSLPFKDNRFHLLKNAEFLDNESVILVTEDLKPYYVYQICEGMK